METAFVDLRRLADWFASLRLPVAAAAAPPRPSPALIERVVRRLGTRCVPLLLRELVSSNAAHREAARDGLAVLASDLESRARVLTELRKIAADTNVCDEGKVAALGILAEHGERVAARFADANAMQRRSALALASQLDSEADRAAAADMMIHQLSATEIAHLIEVMVEASPGGAYHLAVELCARLDLDAATRERIAELALGGSTPLSCVRGAQRPTQVAVLADSTSQRVVVVASRKVAGERRWRRWAVLVAGNGAIDDCIHEDRSSDSDNAPLLARLVADGYAVASTELERARGIVAAAARQTVATMDAHDHHVGSTRLSSAYYLGRDLLDLGEAHLGGRVHAHPTSTTLGRAVELIADGDLPRAQVLLARCEESADWCAATGAVRVAQQRFADALPHFTRAAQLEPEFPLHHWNVGCVLHHLGDTTGCYAALRRFLATSELPSGLYADPDQASRVGLASKLIAELERSARLTGTNLTPTRRKRRQRRAAAKQ